MRQKPDGAWVCCGICLSRKSSSNLILPPASVIVFVTVSASKVNLLGLLLRQCTASDGPSLLVKIHHIGLGIPVKQKAARIG